MKLTCLEISPKIETIILIDWSGNFLGDCLTYAVMNFSQE